MRIKPNEKVYDVKESVTTGFCDCRNELLRSFKIPPDFPPIWGRFEVSCDVITTPIQPKLHSMQLHGTLEALMQNISVCVCVCSLVRV